MYARSVYQMPGAHVKLDHIVVATDLTEDGRECHPHVAAWSRAFRAKVTLLHVTPAPFDMAATSVPAFVKERLAEELAGLARLGVNKTTSTVRFGDVTDAVEAFVEEKSADMLIVAKYSTLLQRLLKLGSTANRILASSKVPVLVVHSRDTPREPAHIVVAVDATERGGESLGPIIELARLMDAKVTVVHVLEGHHMVDRLDPRPDGTTVTPQEGLLALLHKMVEPYAYQGMRVRVAVADGKSAGEVIVETAAEEGANLIAIASSGKGLIGRTFLGSTTRKVCTKATIPVFVMPASWLHDQA